ncbi:transaldolase family protein, partial [Streptomyces sp. NPDC056728]
YSMLDTGQIQHYIDQYSVSGLTSNPSIFDKAIGSGDYDDAIRAKAARGPKGEELFFELAIEDLQRAADPFLPTHERTDGVDGCVSLEVSPLLAYDTQRTVAAAKACTPGPTGATSSSRSPARPRGCRRSRRSSPRAFR